jgi:uncharacterized membrane protein
MIIKKTLLGQNRQSGKTASLKLYAIELHVQCNTVVYISFNRQNTKDVERFFKKINMNIKCESIVDFNLRNVYIKPENKLIGDNIIYIILDEYSLMDSKKLNQLLNDCEHSNFKYVIYGKTT